MLFTVVGSSVYLTDPVAFSNLTDEARSHRYQTQLAGITASGAAQSEAMASRLNNQSKLWIKHNKRLVLSGVAINGDIIRAEPQRSLELGKAWQPTFTAKEFDAEHAHQFQGCVLF